MSKWSSCQLPAGGAAEHHLLNALFKASWRAAQHNLHSKGGLSSRPFGQFGRGNSPVYVNVCPRGLELKLKAGVKQLVANNSAPLLEHHVGLDVTLCSPGAVPARMHVELTRHRSPLFITVELEGHIFGQIHNASKLPYLSRSQSLFARYGETGTEVNMVNCVGRQKQRHRLDT